jgi:TonB family protein
VIARDQDTISPIWLRPVAIICVAVLHLVVLLGVPWPTDSDLAVPAPLAISVVAVGAPASAVAARDGADAPEVQPSETQATESIPAEAPSTDLTAPAEQPDDKRSEVVEAKPAETKPVEVLTVQPAETPAIRPVAEAPAPAEAQVAQVPVEAEEVRHQEAAPETKPVQRPEAPEPRSVAEQPTSAETQMAQVRVEAEQSRDRTEAAAETKPAEIAPTPSVAQALPLQQSPAEARPAAPTAAAAAEPRPPAETMHHQPVEASNVTVAERGIAALPRAPELTEFKQSASPAPVHTPAERQPAERPNEAATVAPAGEAIPASLSQVQVAMRADPAAEVTPVPPRPEQTKAPQSPPREATPVAPSRTVTQPAERPPERVDPTVRPAEESPAPRPTLPAVTENTRKRNQRAARSAASNASSRAASHASISASPGASGGTASADYRALVVAELNRRKFYPSSAQAARITGVVTVQFSVNASGRISAHSISRSSGHSVLDDAVRQMMPSVSLPPPPGGIFRATVPIRFSIN